MAARLIAIACVAACGRVGFDATARDAAVIDAPVTPWSPFQAEIAHCRMARSQSGSDGSSISLTTRSTIASTRSLLLATWL